MTTFQDDYLEWARGVTDAPPFYHKALSYSIVSSAIANQIFMKYGPYKIWPNLYTLVIGPSSLSRKSWSVRMAYNLIREVRPGMLIHDCSSRESFLSELADVERIPSECGVLRVDEFKGFMDRLKNKAHYQGLLQDISTIYDHESIIRRIGVKKDEKETHRIENPFLNILSSCSYDWFTESIRKEDITGGFMARFIWVVWTEKNNDPWPFPKEGDLLLKAKLLSRLERIRDLIGEIVWTDESRELWTGWYKTFRVAHQSDMWDQNYERLCTIAQKIAMLHAIMRVEEENNQSLRGAQINVSIGLTKADVGSAQIFVEDLADAFQHVIIGGTKLHVKQQKIERFLKKKKKATRSQILQGIYDLSAWELDQIKQTLEGSELVEVLSQNGAKKSAEAWKWLG